MSGNDRVVLQEDATVQATHLQEAFIAAYARLLNLDSLAIMEASGGVGLADGGLDGRSQR